MNKISPSYALSQQNLMDMFDATRHAMANMCLNSAGLAIGTPATGVVIANTVNYLSNGEFKSKTTVQVAFTATTHDIPANATLVREAVYMVMLASDGTASLVMGPIASGAGNALLPERPATGTPIGYVRVAVAAGATPFDATTDLLSAGHLTDTYVNLGVVAGKFGATQ